MWVPDYKSFPQHPVTRGVGPFALLDEWYFNMRWPENTNGITWILVDTPSDKVRKGPYVYPSGPYDHIVAASGRAETMMWTFNRPDGGRGFGFTGGHKHVNWSNDNWRKVVLNAIVWIAKADVPATGIDSSVAPEDLAINLDRKNQPADAVNLTGHWTCHVQTDNGSGDPTFDFIHAGGNLLGQYKGLFGTATVFGSVGKTNAVSFWFDAQRQDQVVPMRYTGAITSPSSMRGTVKFGDAGEGTWTGKK
jgi:hypothetical protein